MRDIDRKKYRTIIIIVLSFLVLLVSGYFSYRMLYGPPEALDTDSEAFLLAGLAIVIAASAAFVATSIEWFLHARKTRKKPKENNYKKQSNSTD